jgi:GTP cyclohydrolase I
MATEADVAEGVKQLIRFVGEDPDRPGMEKTPKRYVEAFKYITSGYTMSLSEILNDALFPLEQAGDQNMIMVRDIQIYSTCEHHLLPFHGVCHIAYIPTDKVLGLSKLARIADMFSRRLQIQERLCDQIAQAVEEAVGACGVGVVIHAEHMCMSMRGVQKPGTVTTTSALRGCFRTDSRTRLEFLSLVGQPHK